MCPESAPNAALSHLPGVSLPSLRHWPIGGAVGLLFTADMWYLVVAAKAAYGETIPPCCA